MDLNYFIELPIALETNDLLERFNREYPDAGLLGLVSADSNEIRPIHPDELSQPYVTRLDGDDVIDALRVKATGVWVFFRNGEPTAYGTIYTHMGARYILSTVVVGPATEHEAIARVNALSEALDQMDSDLPEYATLSRLYRELKASVKSACPGSFQMISQAGRFDECPVCKGTSGRFFDAQYASAGGEMLWGQIVPMHLKE